MCRKIVIILLFIWMILFFPISTIYAEDEERGIIRIHFIDVGQGDSILIETPNYKHILIDAGPPKAGKLVVDYLEQQHVSSIDAVIATHPDFDHIGGLPAVMESFPVDQLIETGKFHLTKSYAAYAATVFLKQIPLTVAETGDFIHVDPFVSIEVLNSSTQKKENNPSSLALKITYDDMNILLMADVEKAQEKKMMQYSDVDADIIKIAHHGSNTSSSAAFLEEVQPEIAILTYSKQNDFGHPAPRVIHELQSLSSLIYSTAVFGNIVIESNGHDFFVLPEKSPFDAIYE